MPRLTLVLSGVERADVEGGIQGLPQARRVSRCAQLVDELENATDIVVDLEYLHRQRGLKAGKRSFLWRLSVPHWGLDIRKSGFDILKTHGGGWMAGSRWRLPNQAIHAATYTFLASKALGPLSLRNA